MLEKNLIFFFSSRRRHTRCSRDWSSDVCSSDLLWRRGDAADDDLFEVGIGYAIAFGRRLRWPAGIEPFLPLLWVCQKVVYRKAGPLSRLEFLPGELLCDRGIVEFLDADDHVAPPDP